MKRKVIVEIEYPDNVDACWDQDKSGMQAFHDTVGHFAMAHTIDALSMAIESCKKRGITEEKEREKDPYYKFVMREIEIINKMNPCGYVDENNVVHIYNKKTQQWEDTEN